MSNNPTHLSHLQVDGLCFAYPQQPPLFRDWSANINAGVTLLRGGEGRGKTTLLRVLAGELQPQAGHLRLNGATLDARANAPTAALHVFRADPRSEAFEQITPTDYFASLQARYPAFDRQEVALLAEDFSLTPHLHKPMYMLSTGSKRKVWLVAAFASDATVTLLDEPFAALDKPSISKVITRLADAADQRTRLFVVANYEGLGDVPLTGEINLGE